MMIELRTNNRGQRISLRILAIAFALCFVLGQVIGAAPVADPFAYDAINYFPGPSWYVYDDSIWMHVINAEGAPQGRSVYEPYYDEEGEPSVVTLGDGGQITLVFATPVQDDPHNPYGLDFIVFSNALFAGQNYLLRWQELAFVEISQDNLHWYLIDPSIYPAALRVNNGPVPDPNSSPFNYDCGQSWTVVNGYAEYTPTVGLPQVVAPPSFTGVNRTNEEFYTVPDRPSIPPLPGMPTDTSVTSTVRFDYVSGGGDALDIAKAVVETAPGIPLIVGGHTVPAGISWFRYVRLTDARTGDSWGNLFDVSADIDAVSRTRPALSIGETKALPSDNYGLITEAIVTAVFPNEFFIETPNRSAAMRVKWTATRSVLGRVVAVGDKVTITGHISKANNRFSFDDPMFSFTALAQPVPKPMGIPIRNLSTSLAYGMRVRTWGKVTEPGDGVEFTIADGTDSVKVSCSDYFEPLDPNTYVSVTGICDREEGTGNTVIRVTSPSDDIKSYP